MPRFAHNDEVVLFLSSGNDIFQVNTFRKYPFKKFARRGEISLEYPSTPILSVSLYKSSPNFFPCSIASSYPASVCRNTPMAGSLCKTLLNRASASAVPSATITIPACKL